MNSKLIQLPPREASRINHFVNWILRIVPAVIVGRAAMMKFSGDKHVSMMFDSLGMEPGRKF